MALGLFQERLVFRSKIIRAAHLTPDCQGGMPRKSLSVFSLPARVAFARRKINDFQVQPPANRSRKSLRLRVAHVMFFNALREQAFAAPLATTCEYCTPAFRPHPGAKAVLAFPCPFRWLVCAFHKTRDRCPRD